MAPHTRPRPSSIDQLPEECEGIVAWAVQELAISGRSQTDVYKDFERKLRDLQRELGVIFTIPHFSSFNRHNLRLAKLTARMRRTQMIADAVVVSTDGQESDKLMQAATRMLKTLIVEMMESADDNGFTPKEAASAASAFYRLQQAENLSTARRQKLDDEVKERASKAIDAVAKAKGLTKETTADIKAQILGAKI